MSNYKVGDTVSGIITGITDYGIFVKLDDEYTGMIHISEISDRYISSLERMYVLEETIESKILEIDEEKLKPEARLKEAQYFDDEELDRFAGLYADSYSPEEEELWRDVLYTLRHDELLAWERSIKKRGIQLPHVIKEELISMVNG